LSGSTGALQFHPRHATAGRTWPTRSVNSRSASSRLFPEYCMSRSATDRPWATENSEADSSRTSLPPGCLLGAGRGAGARTRGARAVHDRYLRFGGGRLTRLHEDQDEVTLRGGTDLGEQILGRTVGAGVVVDRGEQRAIRQRVARDRALSSTEQRLESRAQRVPGLGAHLAVLVHAEDRHRVAGRREVACGPGFPVHRRGAGDAGGGQRAAEPAGQGGRTAHGSPWARSVRRR
jgi:hypothetical protein